MTQEESIRKHLSTLQIPFKPNGHCIEICRQKKGNSGQFGTIKYPKRRINGKDYQMHRYVYEKFHGPIPKGMVIRHKCDNPACVNPDHLILGTHADNVADRVKRDRSAKGEDNGRAKLTAEKVKSIFLDNTSTYNELAREHGVDKMVISRIKKRKSWVKVTQDLPDPIYPEELKERALSRAYRKPLKREPTVHKKKRLAAKEKERKQVAKVIKKEYGQKRG